MTSFRSNLLAALSGVLLSAAPALAEPITYASYSVLNSQSVTLSDPAQGINKAGGSGQISLNGTNSIGGMLRTWCIDIAHMLQSSGSFTTGTVLSGDLGTQINALITHGTAQLDQDPNASSALQVAIWKVEYGSALTVTASADVLALAGTYVANVGGGSWSADPTMQVAVLAGNGSNQDQAYLTAVPEPASVAALAAGLFGMGLLRRREMSAI